MKELMELFESVYHATPDQGRMNMWVVIYGKERVKETLDLVVSYESSSSLVPETHFEIFLSRNG